MSTPIFERLDGGKFEIGARALRGMLQFVQDTSEKTEAGGVLMGRHILGCTDVVVDAVTSPMAEDRRTRRRFHRARVGHQQALDRRWSESGGTCVYLGGWHTHAEPYPIPSDIDDADWKRRLQEDVFDGDALYFVVVGTEALRVWIVAGPDGSRVLLGEYRYQEGRDVQDEDTR